MKPKEEPWSWVYEVMITCEKEKKSLWVTLRTSKIIIIKMLFLGWIFWILWNMKRFTSVSIWNQQTLDSPRSPSFIFFNLHQQPVGAHPRLRYMWRRSWERPLRTASKTDAKLPKPRSLNSIEKKIKWINREELNFIYIKPNRRRRETINNSFDCRWLTLQNCQREKRNRLSEHKIRSIIDRKFYTDQKKLI